MVDVFLESHQVPGRYRYRLFKEMDKKGAKAASKTPIIDYTMRIEKRLKKVKTLICQRL